MKKNQYTVSSRFMDVTVSGAYVFWVANRSNHDLVVTRMIAHWRGDAGAAAELVVMQGGARPTTNHMEAFTRDWDQDSIPEKIDALRWDSAGAGMEGAVNGEQLSNAMLVDGQNCLGHVGYALGKGDCLGFVCAPAGKLCVEIECERKDW